MAEGINGLFSFTADGMPLLGYTIGASIAYAWLPAPAAVPGTRVEIDYFGAAVPATAREEPLFDPGMARLRS